MKLKRLTKVVAVATLGVFALALASCSGEDIASAKLFNDGTELETPTESQLEETTEETSTSEDDVLDDMEVDEDYWCFDEDDWYCEHDGHGYGHGHGHGHNHHGDCNPENPNGPHHGWDDEWDEDDEDEDVIYVSYEEYVQLKFIYDSYKAGKLTIDATYFEEQFGFSFEEFLEIFGEDEEDENLDEEDETVTPDSNSDASVETEQE